MKKLAWAAMTIAGASLATTIAFTGCGSEEESSPDTDSGADTSNADTGLPGDSGGSLVDVNNPECRATGTACTSGTECCSNNCLEADGGPGLCASPTNICKNPGDACTSATECCTTSCVGGKCSDKQCVADNGACNANEECCGQTCTNHVCTPINPGCKSDGNPCGGDGECCSKQCNNGVCGNVSFCTQPGDLCASDAECCGGKCTKAAGATYGTCGTLSTSCNSAGTLCGSGGEPSACDNKCCSRACGPWGTTGIRVCQPPSGCKPTDELCSKSSECCGSDPNPSLSTFHTECKLASGSTTGTCTLQNKCDPPGGICKIGSEACGIQNRCCDPADAPSPSFCQANPDNCCRKDALGVPRCIISAFACDGGAVTAGTQCATSADCCGQPCVDNKCLGGCVNATGKCTTTADCCSGLLCVDGVCGGSTLPDGGTADGGGPADAASCTLYGQACTVQGECCSGVPCTAGFCRYP